MAPIASRSSPPRRSARRAARSRLKLRQSFKASSALLSPRARREARTTKTLPPKPSSVCTFCWNGPIAAHYGLFHPPLQLDEARRVCVGGGYSYFISRYRWTKGATSDCVWCTFVRQTLRGKGPVWRGGPVTGLMKITIGVDPHGMELDVRRPADVQILELVKNDEFGSRGNCIYICTSADDPAAEYIVMRDPILDVGSPRSLSAAKAHLEDCVHGHERCNRLSPPSDVRLPTRLVDCNDPDRPRLVRTEGDYGKYLALSYVWGEAQPHRTTQDNISIYRAGIDASLLPQTIRDAIYVTHQLGFQYLWTDSLCIVQDSDEDKLHEIGRMHLIYRRAHLTIVAARASRVSEGFLQDRAPEYWQEWAISVPFLCPSRSPASEEKLVGKVHVYEHPYIIVPSPEPIHTRGWCLQEFCMSPRVLIFGERIFRFRCHSAMQNIGNSFYRHKVDYSDHTIQLPDSLFDPDGVASLPEHGSKQWFDVHKQWSNIVERYSGRSLGQSSDKLVACGAIATMFHRVLRSDYLAGLWSDTLLRDLLWRSPRPDGLRSSTDYRGPSWSWISVDGDCRTHSCTVQSASSIYLAEVAHCEVTLKDMGNPFGEVIGGFLVLKAPLIHCRAVGSTRYDGYCHGEIEVSLELLPAQRDQWPRVSKVVESAPRRGYSIDTSHDFPESCSTIWQLVPIGENAGLVVVPADPGSARTHTESGQVYRRIGVFDLTWDYIDPRPTNALEHALQYDRVPWVEIEII